MLQDDIADVAAYNMLHDADHHDPPASTVRANSLDATILFARCGHS